ELGGIPAKGGRVPDGGTLARLDINGEQIYGMSAHGQKVTVNANNFQFGHAETDALQQAFNKAIKTKKAVMYVDNDLCKFCRRKDGLIAIMKNIGLKELT
ncbi:MAG: adhesin, partial [Desulfobacteraceae bacterium]|nr:adhesin [Desulfobacteraceae bacterium]